MRQAHRGRRKAAASPRRESERLEHDENAKNMAELTEADRVLIEFLAAAVLNEWDNQRSVAQRAATRRADEVDGER